MEGKLVGVIDDEVDKDLVERVGDGDRLTVKKNICFWQLLL
jgi:hypothetical protein